MQFCSGTPGIKSIGKFFNWDSLHPRPLQDMELQEKEVLFVCFRFSTKRNTPWLFMEEF